MKELKEYLKVIDEAGKDLCGLSDAVWENPETAFTEYRSAKLLTEFLKKQGFRVEEGVCGIETAFTAAFGSGSPKIGFLGEFDALSGMSQKAGILAKEAVQEGCSGHGCGHNLLGVGALAAAMALKAYLEDGHEGTVIYYGCPGEEGGSGKAFMAREGIFDGLDCAITWHPGTMNMVCKDSSLANFQLLYEFEGKSAHAAGCPELGRSALDALELMNVGCNFLREHMPEKARVHYAITDTGGYSPNVVQSRASAVYLVRAPKQQEAYELMERVNRIAEGAALMTDTKMTYRLIKSCANTVPNRVLEEVMYQAMQDVGVPEYTEEEYELAGAYRDTAGEGPDTGFENVVEDHLQPENLQLLKSHRKDRLYDFIVPYEPVHLVKSMGGSTDVGDVSWQCPTVQINTAVWAPKSPGHSWQVVAQGKSSIAHKGMLYSGKCMALGAMRLMESPEILKKAEEEFKGELNGQTYIAIPSEIRPTAISQLK